jgi:hypothetical protein
VVRGIGTRQLNTAAESRAEQPASRPDASQQGVAVVSERALAERTRESSLPETLSDKQVHTHNKRQERPHKAIGYYGPQIT